MNIVDPDELLTTLPLPSLANLATFGALPEDAIYWLLKHGSIRSLEPSETLFSKGERVSEFYIVLTGKVSSYRPLQEQLVLTRVCKPGEPIGFNAMIALHDRYSTTIANEKSLLLEISCDTFHEMHEVLPQEFGIFLLNLTRELARSVGLLGDRVTQISAMLLKDSGE